MQTVTSEDCGTFDFIPTETQFITENESFINTCVSDVNTEQVNRWVVLPSRLQSVTASVLQFLHSTETSSWSADTQTSDQSADEPNGHSTGQEGNEAYLEGAVGHVTDVDDVIRRVAEHPSKPDASEQRLLFWKLE